MINPGILAACPSHQEGDVLEVNTRWEEDQSRMPRKLQEPPYAVRVLAVRLRTPDVYLLRLDSWTPGLD